MKTIVQCSDNYHFHSYPKSEKKSLTTCQFWEKLGEIQLQFTKEQKEILFTHAICVRFIT